MRSGQHWGPKMGQKGKPPGQIWSIDFWTKTFRPLTSAVKGRQPVAAKEIDRPMKETSGALIPSQKQT